MKRLFSIMVLVLSTMVILSSCGGGGGGGGDGAAPTGGGSLTGTWYGYLLDSNSSLHILNVTVNSNNTITGELKDNSATGVTHTIAAVSGQPQLFSLQASNGAKGGFFVDSSFTHAVSYDSARNLVVLQKGATSLPTNYSANDTVGTWSGFEVIIDNNFNLVDTFISSAAVLQNLSFTVNNKNGTTTGTIARWVSGYGAFGVDVTLPGNVAGDGTIIMSADKNFAGGFTCQHNSTSLTECSFSAWKRQ